MTLQIILLPQALEDLEEVMDPLWTKLMDKIQLLKEFPSLGPPLDGLYLGYRALTVGIFRVMYRIVSDQAIEVAYVRHCKRDLP